MRQRTDWTSIVILGFVLFLFGKLWGNYSATKREQRCTDPEVIMNYVSTIGNIPSYDVYRCDEGLRIVNVRMGQ
jgi:hypothetical protein